MIEKSFSKIKSSVKTKPFVISVASNTAVAYTGKNEQDIMVILCGKNANKRSPFTFTEARQEQKLGKSF